MLTKTVIALGTGWARFSRFWLSLPPESKGPSAMPIFPRSPPPPSSSTPDLATQFVFGFEAKHGLQHPALASEVRALLADEHERIAKTLDNVAGDFRTIAKAAYEAGEHAKGVRNDAKHILFSACARWIRTRRHGAE